MKIFYSWQSDLPNNTNRGFIQSCLEQAAKAIRDDNSISVEPVIDRDTQGISGSPNIAETILKKIDSASIFVCDVSIISPADVPRPTPNPNVLLELGYALKSLGAERIVMIQNAAYGGPESLPFDLRQNRILTYALQPNDMDKVPARKMLAKQAEAAFRLIIQQITQTAPPMDVVKETKRLLRAC